MKIGLHLILLILALLGGIALERFVLKAPSHPEPAVSEAPPIELTLDREEVEEESPKTLPELLSLGESRQQHRALHDIKPEEIEAMLAQLNASDQLTPEALRLKQTLYHRWADRAPEAALAHVLANEKNARLKREIVHHTFGQLAERSLPQALEAFTSLESRQLRGEALESMAHHVKADQLQRLGDYLIDNPSNTPIEGFFRAWGERSPHDELLLDFANTHGREALAATIEGMARSAPDNAIKAATMLDDTMGTNLLSRAIDSLSHTDPALAAEEFAQLPLGPRRNELARHITHQMAREDINAAHSWVESLDPAAQRGAMEELAHEWARQDPHSAGEFALSLPEGEARREAISQVAHRLAQADPGTALDWVNKLEGESAMAAMRGVVSTVADTNPQAAGDLLTQLGPSEAFNDMAGDLAAHWSEFDPNGAAAWVESLPLESEAQHHATERVVNHWMDQDPQSASQWISELPEGDVRNAASAQLVDRVASTDPAAAYEWALTVNDPGHQTEMLYEVFEQWRDRDPQSAEATWNSAPLSQEQREELGTIFRTEDPE